MQKDVKEKVNLPKDVERFSIFRIKRLVLFWETSWTYIKIKPMSEIKYEKVTPRNDIDNNGEVDSSESIISAQNRKPFKKWKLYVCALLMGLLSFYIGQKISNIYISTIFSGMLNRGVFYYPEVVHFFRKVHKK